MVYDFDRMADRAFTDAIKWDALKTLYGNESALPFWVADTDYPTAPEICEALCSEVKKGAFGYTSPGVGYYEAVSKWILTRHDWEIKKEWIVPFGGIVSGIANIIRAFTKEGDGVLIQPPVYFPFYSTVQRSGRRIIENRILGDNISGYTMDFEDLEIKLKSAKMMILCSPHNPLGRVWSKEELKKVVALCKKNDVILLSDEIHWDIMIDGTKHISLGALADGGKVIVATAPSKTFNLAGLQTSNLIFPNKDMREKFEEYMEDHFIEHPNKLGIFACRVAYEKGANWCDKQNEYLTNNAHFVSDFLNEKMKDVTMAKLEGTYLCWLDMRKYGLSSEELIKKMAMAGAALNDGVRFGGKESEGFVRLNIACPLSMLEKGMDIIASALE